MTEDTKEIPTMNDVDQTEIGRAQPGIGDNRPPTPFDERKVRTDELVKALGEPVGESFAQTPEEAAETATAPLRANLEHAEAARILLDSSTSLALLDQMQRDLEVAKRTGEKYFAVTQELMDLYECARQQQHQLHAARYYVHKIRAKIYGDAVANGQMEVEDARLHYGLSMINFDKLMESSRSGAVTAADQVAMDEGFPL